MLSASIEENVSLIVHLMQHRIDVSRVEAPVAAVEYARRLAQRGIPTSALVRAYRLAHARFKSNCWDRLGRQAGDVKVLALVGTVFTRRLFSYVDIVSEQVTAAHERERDLWVRNRAVAQQAAAKALLSGADAGEAETALNYPLGRDHLGLIVWSGGGATAGEQAADPQGVVRSLARVAGGDAPLVVPLDERIAWAWLPLPSGHVLSKSRLAEVLDRWPLRVWLCQCLRVPFQGDSRSRFGELRMINVSVSWCRMRVRVAGSAGAACSAWIEPACSSRAR
jgi:hypothetical protein